MEAKDASEVLCHEAPAAGFKFDKAWGAQSGDRVRLGGAVCVILRGAQRGAEGRRGAEDAARVPVHVKFAIPGLVNVGK